MKQRVFLLFLSFAVQCVLYIKKRVQHQGLNNSAAVPAALDAAAAAAAAAARAAVPAAAAAAAAGYIQLLRSGPWRL